MKDKKAGETDARGVVDPGHWRSSLLELILRVVLVLGGLVYIPSVYAAYHYRLRGVIVVDTIAIGLIIYLSFDRRGAFRLRAAVLAWVTYALGAWLMVSVGSISQIYLLAFSLLATLLLGLRVGLWTVALNFVTMLGVGYFGFASPEMVEPHGLRGFASWVVVTLNFFLVNVLLTLALGSVIRSLEAALERAVAAQRTLESDRQNLLEANRALSVKDENERKLEAQLRQAQKMDAVGRLAGGVAHDFNNMLSVILGNAALTLQGMAVDDAHRVDVEQIIEAGKRSSDLTNQLLAFARQQTIAPLVVDLNDTITNMLKMLRRLIGEDVELIWRPTAGAGRVKVDPSQIDQILANLAVNARDAIASVGTLILETRSVVLDQDFVSAHPGAEAGPFVLLAVTDNGAGMDKDTISRVFEPFFTTKAVGHGTGLGLATVYGIVKQNRGFITVYSELGQGTTFKIYLPQSTERLRRASRSDMTQTPPRGTETILLVEDEEALLRLGQKLLERLGYTVLAAGTAQTALALSANAGVIDVLVTDVIMPQMSGREVCKILQTDRPQLKCLFLSGYTADVIAHRGVLDDGVHFLQKPFTVDQLARKLRIVIDGEPDA